MLFKLFIAFVTLGVVGYGVPITIEVDYDYDKISSFENFQAAGAGMATQSVALFDNQVTHIDGVAAGSEFDHSFAGFCTELAEPISQGSYTMELVELKSIARGQAGVAGTASSNIPEDGIGELRAARIRYLFDTHYTSSEKTDWTISASNAFQLAVWELGHDSDLSLSTGVISVGSQSDTAMAADLNLAQDWLGEVLAANVTMDYESQRVYVWGLENTAGGAQDLLLGILKEESSAKTLDNVVPVSIPEVSASAMLMFALMGLLFQRRR